MWRNTDPGYCAALNTSTFWLWSRAARSALDAEGMVETVCYGGHDHSAGTSCSPMLPTQHSVRADPSLSTSLSLSLAMYPMLGPI